MHLSVHLLGFVVVPFQEAVKIGTTALTRDVIFFLLRSLCRLFLIAHAHAMPIFCFHLPETHLHACSGWA